LAVVLFVSLVVLPLLAVAVWSTFLFRPSGRVLEIEMRATSGTVAQLYWSADYAFNGTEMASQLLHQHPGDFDRLRFPLPDRPLELLRFDPIDGSGEITVRSMRVLTREGQLVRTIDPLVLAPLYQIARITPSPEGVRVETTPGANDPIMLLRASWVVGPSPWRWLQFVTPFALAWIAFAVLAVILAALGFVARDIARGPFDAGHALWFAALFLTVLWAKATLLQHYPVPVPFWDQWDGEAATLYIPWWHDGLSWRQMFMLHNEHRIFFSRVLAVALLVVNGQWDPHLQILVNAVVQSLAALVFAAALWMAMGRKRLPLVIGTIGLVFAPPFALENSLAGFQSAFYFLLLFSALAIWLMTAHRPGTLAWCIGLLCAFCCPFTVAGGLFVVAPIACAIVLKTIAERREWRGAAVSLLALSAVLAVAYAGLPPPIPYHEALKATSARAFGVSFAHNLAFPWIQIPTAAALVWLPFLFLAVAVLVRRLRSTMGERLTCALAVWVLLQAGAMAYSRGGNGVAPASRYLDLLSFGFVLNTVALATMMDQSKRWVRIAATVGVAAWVLAGTAGIARLSREMLITAARQRVEWSHEHVRTVRAFIASGNMEELLGKRGPQELPYHSAWMLANWLQHPYVARILPAIVRSPLPIHPADSGSTFQQTWSSVNGEHILAFDSYGGDRAKNRASFESQPVTCTDFRYLRFEVAGAARDSGLRLSLKDVRTGAETAVSPSPGSRSGWTAATARCPNGPFTIVADDQSPVSWLAFRPPSEIAWGSAVAESMIQRTNVLAGLAILLGVLAVGWSIRSALPWAS
jgi:hypothetical protein